MHLPLTGFREFTGVCLLSLMFIWTTGCKPVPRNWDPGGKAPQGLISEEKMVDLLVDIHLAEGDLIERNIRGAEQGSLLAEYYSAILRVHEVSDTEFADSYDWYIARPMDMHDIYEAVIEELTAIQATTDRKIEEERAARASEQNEEAEGESASTGTESE